MKKLKEAIAKYFDFQGNKTNYGAEFRGGIVTFLAMCYILAVNPNILSASGMPSEAVFLATAISAGVATILMGVLAKLPFALASGMGLNAFFAFTVCGVMGFPWQFALTAILVEGIIFIILSLTGVREAIFNSIPKNLRYAVSIGIGLFIALIGLLNAGIIVADASTAVTHFNFQNGDFHTAGITVLIAIIGLIITAVLVNKKVPGGLLWGILGTWALGMIAQLAGLYVPNPEAGFFSLYPNFTSMTNFGAIKETFVKFDFTSLANPQFWFVVFAFLFVDVFDTLGTLTGCAIQGNMLDEKGKLPGMKKALLTDAIGTTVGACLGTSTVTTFVESSSGIAEGARTGFASIVTGLLFLLALVLSPIFLAIPSFATAPALIMVGCMMMKGSAKQIDWDDFSEAIPAFMVIIMMPFAYSIATGIAYGFVTYTLINLIFGDRKKVNWMMIVLSILFIIKFAIVGN